MIGFVAVGGLARRPRWQPEQRAQSLCSRRPTIRMGGVVEVTGPELEEKLKLAGDSPMLIDFYAPWCGPCQVLLGELEWVAEKYGDQLEVLKVDTENEPDLSSALMIRGLPTMMFVQSGQLKYRMEGALRRDDVADIVDQCFFGAPPRNPDGESALKDEPSSAAE